MARLKPKPYKHPKRRDEDEADPRKDDQRGVYINRWWRAKNDVECARALWLWIDRLRQRWAYDNLIDLIHEAIYEGRPLGTSVEYPALEHLRRSRSAPANLNYTRSMVDSGTARLSKRRPYPVISADDAGWNEKLFAKRVSRVLRRKLAQPEMERLKPDILRDGLIRGTGATKVVRNGGDVTVERVPRYELVVDPREARYNDPRTLAHIKPIPREVLCERFPEYEEEIEKAAAWERLDQWTLYAYDGPSFFDHVEVAEAWHLPSGPGADDGEHVITLRNVVLLREKWTRPRFPIALFHWSPPVRGFWGHGLVEDLSGLQAKLNDVMRDAQEALYYGGMLKIFATRGSNVNKNHLRARHPVVIEHDGAAPTFVAPDPVSQQYFQMITLIIDKMHEVSGLSQMTTASQNPLGPQASGKAIDTMYDIQSDRFAHVEIGQAMWMCDVGMRMVDEARAMHDEARGNTDVEDPLTMDELAPWIRETDWPKVEIDGGSYHLGIEPENFLVGDRAGKLQQIEDLSKAGLIPDPSITAEAFDEPDIARMNRFVLGPKRNLDRIMEGIADEDVPMSELMPDEYMNLPLGILMAKGYLEDARAEETVPEGVVQRFMDWIGFAKAATDLSSQGAGGSPSLPGMPTGPGMPAMPTAGSLQPGLGGGAPPGPPMSAPGMPPGPMAAPGIAA